MGLLDIFKIDELKTKIFQLERQLESVSKEKNELSIELEKQKHEYEKKIENQELQYKKIISHHEAIIAAYEQSQSSLEEKTDNESREGKLALPTDCNRDMGDLCESIDAMRMAQLVALSKPSKSNFKIKKTSKGVVIEKYIGDEEYVEIPAVIDREIVFKIGEAAFINCKTIKRVVLPNTLLEIDERAFSYSTLEEITMNESLVKIGKESFSPTELKSVVVPRNVKVIPQQAFAFSKLETAIIEGAHTIEDEAFYGTELKRLVLPEGLRIIGRQAIEGDYQRLIIPATVEKIGGDNFNDTQHIAILNDNAIVSFYGKYGKTGATIYCNNSGKVFEYARNWSIDIKPLSAFPTEDFDEEDFEDSDDHDYDEKENKARDDEGDDGEEISGNYCGDGELDTSSWNLESILRQEGYTVSQKEDLSDYERQQILLSVMRRNLMSKWQIIEHIELQISLRRNNRMYNVAISKWERDLTFLRRL